MHIDVKHINPCIYFCTKQTLICSLFLGKLWRIQIQIYPETHIEPKYGAFYWNNKVRVHGLVLLVQVSWGVASPYAYQCVILIIGEGASKMYSIRFRTARRLDRYTFRQLDNQTSGSCIQILISRYPGIFIWRSKFSVILILELYLPANLFIYQATLSLAW